MKRQFKQLVHMLDEEIPNDIKSALEARVTGVKLPKKTSLNLFNPQRFKNALNKYMGIN